MSYDLMVFDPEVAPRERSAFRAWYQQQTQWTEDRDYSDPAGTTQSLLRFYHAIREHYPAMNGPDATQDDDLIDRAGDYSIGASMIYATFPWSLAEEVYPRFRAAAVDCGVGFYDVSGDEGGGEIYFPGDTPHPPSQGAWRDVAAEFRQLSKEGEQ